jgi:chromosome segregation ATPase
MMTIEAGGLWTAVIIALLLSGVTFVLAVIQARRGDIPTQREALREMTEQVNEQKTRINALQWQVNDQWARIQDQDRQLALMRTERDALTQRLLESERKAIQVQAIVDQLLPGAGNDRALIAAIRDQLKSTETQLAEARAEAAALKQLAAGGMQR